MALAWTWPIQPKPTMPKFSVPGVVAAPAVEVGAGNEDMTYQRDVVPRPFSEVGGLADLLEQHGSPLSLGPCGSLRNQRCLHGVMDRAGRAPHTRYHVGEGAELGAERGGEPVHEEVPRLPGGKGDGGVRRAQR